jgi:hypothetical protein
MTSISYQYVYTVDPISEERVLCGAAILEGHSLRYVGLRSRSFDGASDGMKDLLRRHREALDANRHPCDIGPQICSGTRWYHIPPVWQRDGWSIDEFLRKANS